jgi:hypothetical protein
MSRSGGHSVPSWPARSSTQTPLAAMHEVWMISEFGGWSTKTTTMT